MDGEVGPSLKRRVINAGVWSIGGYGLSQAIRFGSNLLLTRLLAPELFGVMSIATVIMGGLSMLSDVGLRQNIIQSRRGHETLFLEQDRGRSRSCAELFYG